MCLLSHEWNLINTLHSHGSSKIIAQWYVRNVDTCWDVSANNEHWSRLKQYNKWAETMDSDRLSPCDVKGGHISLAFLNFHRNKVIQKKCYVTVTFLNTNLIVRLLIQEIIFGKTITKGRHLRKKYKNKCRLTGKLKLGNSSWLKPFGYPYIILSTDDTRGSRTKKRFSSANLFSKVKQSGR